jgi:hypothetical protein
MTFALRLFAALALLSAPLTHAQDAPCKRGEAAPGQAGALVFSLATVADQPPLFTKVQLRRIDGDRARERCTIEATHAEAAAVTAYFAAELPAGHYRLSGLGEGLLSEREAEEGEPEPVDLVGIIRVVAGQRSDLGRLVVHMPGTMPQFGARGPVPIAIGRSARHPANDRAELFFEFAPLLKWPKLAQPWVDARHAEDTVEETALANPIGIQPPVPFGDGAVVFPAGASGLLLHDKSGQWSHLQADGGHAINFVRPAKAPGAPLLVAGEHGLIAWLDGSGHFTPVARGTLPVGNILLVDGDDATGWHVIQGNGTAVDVYRSATLEGGSWQLVASEERSPSWWGKDHIVSFWSWLTPTGFAYAVSAGQIHLFEAATGAWTTIDAPSRIADINPTARGVALLGNGRKPTQSSGRKVWVGGFEGFESLDGGRTWTEVPMAKKLTNRPPFVTRDGAALVLRNHPFSPPDLLRSTDRGATWTEVPGAFSPRMRITQLPDGTLYGTDESRVQVSADDGLTWKRIFLSR